MSTSYHITDYCYCCCCGGGSGGGGGDDEPTCAQRLVHRCGKSGTHSISESLVEGNFSANANAYTGLPLTVRGFNYDVSLKLISKNMSHS